MKWDRCHCPTLSACTVGFNGTLAKSQWDVRQKYSPVRKTFNVCFFVVLMWNTVLFLKKISHNSKKHANFCSSSIVASLSVSSFSFMVFCVFLRAVQNSHFSLFFIFEVNWLPVDSTRIWKFERVWLQASWVPGILSLKSCTLILSSSNLKSLYSVYSLSLFYKPWQKQRDIVLQAAPRRRCFHFHHDWLWQEFSERQQWCWDHEAGTHIKRWPSTQK